MPGPRGGTGGPSGRPPVNPSEVRTPGGKAGGRAKSPASQWVDREPGEIMTERERQRAIRLKLCRPAAPTPGVVSSGFPSLDDALGGGFPRRRMVELFGPPSSGKTTLALQAVAHAQRECLGGCLDRYRRDL